MTGGLSVFLVEDEALIRMMMADMVEELGHHVVAEADNVRDASAFAMTAQYDLAILDINLMGLYVDPVADLIERRGKPFMFATGYGPELLPSLLLGGVVAELGDDNPHHPDCAPETPCTGALYAPPGHGLRQ